jgi:ArsR family transcriptional regulator
MRDLTKAFKALADETRLRILGLLLERECCVCEVMQALQVSQTRASRNLSILYDAGFLKLRREGLWAYYAIDRGEMPAHSSDILDAVGKALEGERVVAGDRKRMRLAVRVGAGCASVPVGKGGQQYSGSAKAS